MRDYSIKKTEVMTFLDKCGEIYHKEPDAKMLRNNFGFSWLMCYEYVNEHQRLNNQA